MLSLMVMMIAAVVAVVELVRSCVGCGSAVLMLMNEAVVKLMACLVAMITLMMEFLVRVKVTASGCVGSGSGC